MTRIASYNVRNLFLCGEGEEKPAHEVRALVRAMGQIAADVVMLQEVGSFDSLAELNSRLAQPYPYLGCIPGNSRRGIHLAVLSRSEIELRSHCDTELRGVEGDIVGSYADHLAAAADRKTPVQLQRDLLQVHTSGLTLFGLHLKSKGNPAWQCVPADEIRSLEALAVARIVAEHHRQNPAEPMLLLGDFNDLADADSLAPITALQWFDPHAQKFRELGRNPSTYWPKRRMRLDRMLVSPETVSRIEADSARLFSGDVYRRASDHFPITLDLQQ